MSKPSSYLPPEWAPQSGVMLTWPHRDSDWLPWLEEVESLYVHLCTAIVRFEGVLIACYDEAHRLHIQQALEEAGVSLANIHLYAVPSNDSWARDHGPLTVETDNGLQLLDFTFNGWGKKFSAQLDNQITQRLHQHGAFADLPLKTLDMVLEGGAIETDGAGSLLTTTHCQLSPQRNPQLDHKMIEQRLCDYFGAEQVLWLEHGHLEGDDTDSHIDTLARFCDANTIAYVQCDDEGDSHYADFAAMEAELKTLRNSKGAAYRLVPLPWPKAIYDHEDQRLPATYANFLIINGAVLVPIYNDVADEKALTILADCFPGREVIGINCLPLIHQFGSLHCITMQLPAGVIALSHQAPSAPVR